MHFFSSGKDAGLARGTTMGVGKMHFSLDNSLMTTETEKRTGIPPDLMAELQAAAERAARGIRDHEEMRKAAERMDRLSEEIRKRHGILDIGVPAIRELRDA
jgi:hypothetical protein